MPTSSWEHFQLCTCPGTWASDGLYGEWRFCRTCIPELFWLPIKERDTFSYWNNLFPFCELVTSKRWHGKVHHSTLVVRMHILLGLMIQSVEWILLSCLVIKVWVSPLSGTLEIQMLFLENLPTRLCLNYPFCKICQWSSNCSIVGYVAVLVSCETQDLTSFFVCSGFGALIFSTMFSCHHISLCPTWCKEIYLSEAKRALCWSDYQVCGLDYLE